MTDGIGDDWNADSGFLSVPDYTTTVGWFFPDYYTAFDGH